MFIFLDGKAIGKLICSFITVQSRSNLCATVQKKPMTDKTKKIFPCVIPYATLPV